MDTLGTASSAIRVKHVIALIGDPYPALAAG
jgi:hypothetical protein